MTQSALLLAGASLLAFPLSASAQTADDPVDVTPEKVFEDTILVTGRRIDNYKAVDALTGTRVQALLKDIPLTVSVVPAQLIEDRGINYLGAALDTVPGAQRKLGYGGVQNFGAYLRGFDASFLTLRNGVRDFGFYTLRDAANVERFEVLKGPGSVLYGAVSPGGITNTITKKPTEARLARGVLTVGSDDFYRGELDLGGPLDDNVGYRLNAAIEDAGSFRDQVESNSFFIAPVASFRLGQDTDWIVELEHKKSEYTWDLGLPRDPIIFQLPVSRFLGEPDGINDVDSTYVASVLEHRFNDDWRFRQTTGYAKTDGDYKLRSAFRLSADRLTADRSAFDTEEESKTFVLQNDIAGEFTTGVLEHQLVVGLEYYDVEQSYAFEFRPLAPIDLFNPVYGAQAGAGFPLFADRISSEAYGLYAQNLISIGDKVKLLLGGRYDSVDNTNFNILTNTLTREGNDNAFSPQGGVVYQPDEATSWYVSYGESFLPITSGVTAEGEQLVPEQGQQLEVGVKRSWLDGRLFATFAVYYITKQNVSTLDPDNPLFRVQTGEQRSQGVEFDVSGSPFEGLDLTFATSYIDAEVTEDNRFAVGSRLPGAADFTASLWGKYTVQAGFAENLSVGAGAFYVGDRQAALPNADWTLPAYTRFDAMLSYPFDKVSVQLNIRNLTDKKIYDLTSTSILPQEPRSVSLRLAYDF
ncbi:TonB-dependent siderophore receptor [uncultured Algimonas sp.]|uniref:TonB-dependent siderophore receptor n=1 Tax=uncultured Algimonas sp. TaxID=1547920 RepID=UPI002627F7C6|nr:TonB-dependent siderophore receptor [uncultured Algimonas sp.]